MALIDPRTAGIARSAGLLLLVGWTFWRLFKDNPGNRVIQCGGITLMLALVMAWLLNREHPPVDFVASLGPVLFVLCMLTMFFVFQRGYRAVRRRFANNRSETRNV